MGLSHPETWLRLETAAVGASLHMAIDEVILETATRRNQVALRLYQWCEQSATFGYFQRYAAVQRWTTLRPLIRRPTGGGVVLHQGDWTYSLVFPPSHAWYGLSATESYHRLHQWLAGALSTLGLQVELVPVTRPGLEGRCFSKPTRFDVTHQGLKIAGAAQRRNRQGLLIQGSVQPPPGLDSASWPEAICGEASRQFGVEWCMQPLESTLTRRAQALESAKYRQGDFSRRR